MKPYVETGKLLDKEEIKLFESYLEKPKNILKMGTLDYNSYKNMHPDNLVEQAKFTKFIKPLYNDDDYEDF